MKCCECGYWWADSEDEAPDCHFHKVAKWDLSPCEQEDQDYFDRWHDEEMEALYMI